MSKKWIYVNAFPKAGVTWLVHLLCDALDGTQMDYPGAEQHVWGDTGSSPYIISKQHVAGFEWKPEGLPPGKLVVTVRDPRDMAVSLAYYRTTQDQMAEEMKTLWTGGRSLPPFMERYLGPDNPADVLTRYEWLQNDTVGELRRIIIGLTDSSPEEDALQKAVARQNVQNMRSRLGSHFVRKGVVGDWKNHFTRSMGRELDEHLGEFMLRLGYIQTRSWWQQLPRRR